MMSKLPHPPAAEPGPRVDQVHPIVLLRLLEERNHALEQRRARRRVVGAVAGAVLRRRLQEQPGVPGHLGPALGRVGDPLGVPPRGLASV